MESDRHSTKRRHIRTYLLLLENETDMKIIQARLRHSQYSTTADLYAHVTTTSDVFFVTESPEEVTRKILEYKLAMMRYGASFAEAVKHEEADPEEALKWSEDDLKRLSGADEGMIKEGDHTNKLDVPR